MSRLSRFLPKFLRGDKTASQKSGDKCQCKIIFLDETEYHIPYKGGLKGQLVLDRAFEQLNLFERDYFGLRYIDSSGQTHWLDCNKTLSSQLKACSVPYTFYFGVKFYPADPCKLKEEITRYQFFLQVKQDILHGRLPVTFEEAVELFSYAVQSELGDYDSQELPPGYVSEFQFVPNQTQELEEQVAMLHRRLGGMIPATAELKFLDKVKWLDMYGVDLHPVLGEGNTEYFLGLTPTGIVVYKNKTKVGNYFWPRITKVNFKGKVFIIRVKDKINDEHTYAFELSTKAGCKHLWKCCVEHHTFFRLGQLGAASARESKPYRSTAKHRNSGRQDRMNNLDQSGREQPRVLRVQSRRQARRAMSDSRLNQGDGMTGIQYSEGHVTMVVTPEQVKGSRHRSLPDLKGRESPTSTRSAPWETNADIGLYTSGRESPVSVTQSENVNYLRRHRESDSESGYRKKYFPSSRKGSDNESDVSYSRRRRREVDSGSESDVSPKYTARQRKAKSVGPDQMEKEWQAAMQSMYLQDKENRPNGSIPSVHSAPLGEARQKKMRRRRSKSPGSNKRPPEELLQHIEFNMLEPPEDLTEEQLKEIPYVNVETKAEPFKVKYSPSNRRRYRSPKRKSMGELETGVRGGYTSEEPPPYTRTPERTPEPTHKQVPKPQGGGYYSDTGSLSRREQNHTPYTQQSNNTLPLCSKPIDAVEDNHPVSDHRKSNSTSDTKGHDLKGQDDNEGEGQELDLVDDRAGTGLNNSQGSNSTLTNTPPRGTGQHRFGTQDAIAKLYSSPAGTRQPNVAGNQNNRASANQNLPFNIQTNQNGSYTGHSNQNVSYNRNHGQPASQNPLYSPKMSDRSHMGNSQTVAGYDNNLNMLKSVNANYMKQSSVPLQREHQRTHPFSESVNPVTVPPRQPVQNGMVNHASGNRLQFSAHKMFYTQSDNISGVNAIENQPSQNSSYSSDSAFAHLNNAVTRSGFNSQNTFYTQSNVQNYNAQNHSSRTDRLVVHSNQDSINQSNFDSRTNYESNFETRLGNQSTAASRLGVQTPLENRLGLQPQWQYVGADRKPETRRSEHTGHGAKSTSDNVTQSTWSPASSPSKSKSSHIEMSTAAVSRNISTNQNSSYIQTGSPSTKTNSSNQSNSFNMTARTPPRQLSANQIGTNISNFTVMPPTYLSPDSAISSVSSLSMSNKTSPQKMTGSNTNSPYTEMGKGTISSTQGTPYKDKGSEGYSRTRTPAFGRSDIWTEL